MASMPAYQYDAAPRYPSYAPQPQQSPDIRVVPGRRPTTEDALSPTLLFLAKVAVVMMVLFAVLGFARVGLASATVSTAVSVDNLTGEIATVRSQGNDLEVQQSNLSNPAHLKQVAAGELGMGEAAESLDLRLSKDIVSTDAQGNLSLSASIQAATIG